MTTSARDGWVEIDVRITGLSESSIFGVMRATSKRVEIPKSLEKSGNWKYALPGDTVQLVVTMTLAEEQGITSVGPTRLTPGGGGMISG